MSSIEWTDETWNPVVGCTRAPSGCDNCYAVKMSHRLEGMGQDRYAGLTVLNPRGDRHFNGTVRTVPEVLDKPLKWRKPRMVFVNSMSDLFHPKVPFEFIDKVFAVMALTPQHTYQVLTKRPERLAEYFTSDRMGIGGKCCDVAWEMGTLASLHTRSEWAADAGQVDCGNNWPLPNVWLGTSVENQQAADERIPHLLQCPAAVRFLSCEPLLGSVNLRAVKDEEGKIVVDALGGVYWRSKALLSPPDGSTYESIIHWVIVGGESGPGARPFNIAWARSIIGQCKAAGVACFVKQLGSRPVCDGDGAAAVPYSTIKRKGGDPAEWPEDLRVREFPESEPQPA